MQHVHMCAALVKLYFSQILLNLVIIQKIYCKNLRGAVFWFTECILLLTELKGALRQVVTTWRIGFTAYCEIVRRVA